jgi:hypothetical protein
VTPEDNPADDISEEEYYRGMVEAEDRKYCEAIMNSPEYAQGYDDAHPFNQDCDICGGKGWHSFDEYMGREQRCQDCNPEGKQ